jgi:signal transduction histidine kinase
MTSVKPLSLRHNGPTVAALARLLIAGICGLLLLSSSSDRVSLGVWLLALVAVAVVATLAPNSPTNGRLSTLVEGALWATGVLLNHGHPDALLPYLVAPGLVGGLARGLEGVAVPVGAAAVAIVSGVPTLTGGGVGALIADAGQWIGITLLVGLLAAWGHRLSAPAEPGYVEAFRLLEQLRTLTRTLPVGLDAASIAEHLLRELQTEDPSLISAAVYTRAPGNLPALRATTKSGRANWGVDISDDSVYAEAWATGTATFGVVPGSKGATHNVAVLPLVVANRTVGIVVMDVGSKASPPKIAKLQSRLDTSALRLETAMLFDEIREMATVEERRRLAREIHDGIAQDLASFGYEIDALARQAVEGASPVLLRDELTVIRKRLSSLVTELRNSIFELRSEVDQHGGLGAALSEYVRGVGAASSMTVHLSLAERPDRLPSDVEAELLRIAQEAVTNARKHAQAANLWVTCKVDPPRAVLIVEDDGIGPGTHRDGSYGLEIMQERADRLKAQLVVAPRRPRGTKVTCRLGIGG